MPKAKPTPTDVAVDTTLFATEDMEGFIFVKDNLEVAKNSYLTQIESATSKEQLDAILVQYAV